MLNKYEVILEGKDGSMYRHTCEANSKRESAVEAQEHVNSLPNLLPFDYVIIDCKSMDTELDKDFEYKKSHDEQEW